MRLLIPSILALVISGCEPFEPSTEYTPILMERSELETSIEFRAPEPLVKTGKIYTYQDYVFIGERFRGIHILDNSDPTNPKNMGFLKIPGNVDIAIKNNILYADNAVDLISLNLTELPNIKTLTRNEEVFPDLTPPDLDFLPTKYEKANRPKNTVIINWEIR